MTREEAIKRLENHTQYYVPVDDLDALDMAIAALREQCVRDATKTSGWISVEDRLPEAAERVLVRLGGDRPRIGETRMDTDRVRNGQWVRWFNLVTHWMPLPEPPEEEEV